MNNNTDVRTIDNISYNITRVFSNKESIEEIIRKIVNESQKKKNPENETFTEKISHDIINYE